MACRQARLTTSSKLPEVASITQGTLMHKGLTVPASSRWNRLFTTIWTTAGLIPVSLVMITANAANSTIEMLVPVRAASRTEARCEAGESYMSCQYGGWRTSDSGNPVDSTGALPGRAPFQGVAGLRNILITDYKDQFLRAVIERLLSY